MADRPMRIAISMPTERQAEQRHGDQNLHQGEPGLAARMSALIASPRGPMAAISSGRTTLVRKASRLKVRRRSPIFPPDLELHALQHLAPPAPGSGGISKGEIFARQPPSLPPSSHGIELAFDDVPLGNW